MHKNYIAVCFTILTCPGDSAVVQLALALKVNSGLEMLLVADNPFGDEGGQQMTSALCQANRTLKVLDIHGTHMDRAMEKKVGFFPEQT